MNRDRSPARNSSLARLALVVRPHARHFGAAVAALGASVALGHLVPLLAGRAIDAAAARAGVAPAPDGALLAPLDAHPWLTAAAIVLVTAASGAFAWLRARWSSLASEGAIRDLRDRLHDHVQRLPCRVLESWDSGDLVQRCTSDVETVRLFLSTQVVEVGRSLLMIVLALPIMLWLDVRMTLVSLVLFPPILAYGAVFFGRIQQRFLAADEAEAAMTSVLHENLTGVRVVRAFAREDHEAARFGAAAAGFRDRHLRVIRLMGTYWASSDLLCGVQIALAMFAGAAWAARGELGVGELYAFMAWVALLVFPVRQMGRTLTDAGKAVVALRRIFEVLDVPAEADPERPAELPARWEGRIEVRGLRFAHGPGRPVLDGIDLTVEAGQVLALVGPPGCGKSTLVALLLRFHDPDAGSIRMDGVDLSEVPRRLVRSLVATVPQEPFLYSRTIERNVRVARPRATRDEVEQAARAACVHDAITRFPDGYDTLVGERGVTLSGGQRQRVAIARALLETAPVLVLDDALSAVDTRTESRIREALAARRGRRTCIVIAHRLATARQADVVAVLEGGRVVQVGTHEQLAAVDGPYGRLWDIQSDLEADLASALDDRPGAAGAAVAGEAS